jgi:hypothetical protein
MSSFTVLMGFLVLLEMETGNPLNETQRAYIANMRTSLAHALEICRKLEPPGPPPLHKLAGEVASWELSHEQPDALSRAPGE